MEHEEGDHTDLGKEKGANTMRFSFTASKTKFSASRPPLFPKVKHRSDEGDVELVTGFDEQGIVAKDPKGLRGARVIPKLENSWRPEKRMKNIIMETDVLTSTSEDRFEKEETIHSGAAPGVKYGLSVVFKKVETTIQQISDGPVKESNGNSVDVNMDIQNDGIAPLTMAQLEDQALRRDLVTLPDEADMDAYEDMPVEDYGEAILRGMGWEKGKPIGRNSKVAVVPVEYVRRSGRTGLGAEPVTREANNSKQIKPGQSREPLPDLVASVGADGRVRNVVTIDEKLVERSRKGVLKGKVMSVISGRHLGLRGEVLDSERADRVSVKLVKSGETIFVSATDLVDVGSLEEEKVLKQIRQLKIGNGEAPRRERRRENSLDEEDGPSDRRKEKKHGRKEDKRGVRREKESRRDDGAEHDYGVEDEERRSSSRRDSRQDEKVDQVDRKSYGSREGKRGRSRDENSRMYEGDKEGTIRKSDDSRVLSRDQRGEVRREDGRRGSSDGRRVDDRSSKERVRHAKNSDERESGTERRSSYSQARESEDRLEKQSGGTDRDGGGGVSNGRYKDAWLTSQIRVRIISKTLKGGRIYLKKARIVDVSTPTECDILVDESGEILQHIRQDQLETALPKRGGRIMVVGGKQRGQLGKLIERDSEGEVGLVQMEESFDMINLDLDLLAEFVGDAGERDD